MKKVFGCTLLAAVGLYTLIGCSVLKKEQNVAGPIPGIDKAAVYTTADNTSLRLTNSGDVVFSSATQPSESDICVFVEPQKVFQSIVGFGSAITDASAEVFAKLPSNKQAEFLKAFYDANSGIGYSLMRTNMNSCDFSSGSYTYVREGDSALASFNIEHDKQFKLPLIKKAFEAAGNKMTLFVSPWSPPAFMKDNNHMLRGGKLLPNFYQPWANYFVKFINAYESEGVPVWGVTIQNEPMAVQKWESCVFTAEEERDFLKYYLGPTFKKQGMADKKIIVWDHNRDLMGHRANIIFGDKQAAQYAWGSGYHWYEKWSGGESLFDNVDRTLEMYPDKPVLFTEGCIEKFDSAKYHYWPNAERYGREMINDLNNGTVGWCDWNILLDQNGGPNHVGNFCFAPVHANTITGELIYTPTYYYIGHFSKFVKPNAKRVSTMVSRSALSSVSFANSDGSIATVVMNSSDKLVKYRLVVGSKQTDVSIEPHAIQTIVY